MGEHDHCCTIAMRLQPVQVFDSRSNNEPRSADSDHIYFPFISRREKKAQNISALALM